MSKDKELLRKEYSTIIVIPIDVDKFSKDITEQIKAEIKKAGDSKLVTLKSGDEDFYCLRGGLGVIKGTNIVVDRELCGDILKGEDPELALNVYHETRDADNKTKSFDVFASVTARPKLSELLAEYALPEVDLPTFMETRFAYNHRIVSNMNELKKALKK